jgi:hypothetical protein
MVSSGLLRRENLKSYSFRFVIFLNFFIMAYDIPHLGIYVNLILSLKYPLPLFYLYFVSFSTARYIFQTQEICRPVQNKWRWMLTFAIVIFHNNARNWPLMEHINWELFDHSPYNPYLAQSDCHLLTFQQSWVRPQRFRSNDVLVESVGVWLGLKAVDFLTPTQRTLFPEATSALTSAGDNFQK